MTLAISNQLSEQVVYLEAIDLKFDISYLLTRPQSASPGAFVSPHAPKGCAILSSYRRTRASRVGNSAVPRYACQTRPFLQYSENIKNTLTLPT